MPAKSGASHGVAAFTTLVVGTVFSNFVWTLLPPLGELSLLVFRTLDARLGLAFPVNEQFAGTVVVMVGLSTMWGVLYHFSRHSGSGAS
jgi:hypothetical protein